MSRANAKFAFDPKLLTLIEDDDYWQMLHGLKTTAANLAYKFLKRRVFDKYPLLHNHPLEENPELNEQARKVCLSMHQTFEEFVNKRAKIDDESGTKLLKHLAERDGYNNFLKFFKEPTERKKCMFQFNLQMAKFHLDKMKKKDRKLTAELASVTLKKMQDNPLYDLQDLKEQEEFRLKQEAEESAKEAANPKKRKQNVYGWRSKKPQSKYRK